MIVSMKTTIQVKYSTTAGELAKIFASLPAGAKINVRQEKHYDQRDPGGTFIDATWSEVREL